MIYEVTYNIPRRRKHKQREANLPAVDNIVYIKGDNYKITKVVLGSVRREIVSIPYIFPAAWSNYIEDIQSVTVDVWKL